MKDVTSLSNEELMAIIGKNQGQSQQVQPRVGSTTEEIARPLARTARSATTGTLGAAGDLAKMVMAPVNKYGEFMMGLGDKITGGNVAERVAAENNAPMPSQVIRQGFDSATEGLTVPRNAMERIIDTASEAVAGGGAAGMSSKTAALGAKTGQELASFAGAGAGGQAAKEVFPENPVAEVAGALIGGATPFTGSVLRVNPNKVATFEKANIRPTLADVSDANTVKSFQNIVKEVPGSAGVVEKAVGNTFDDAERALNRVGLGVAKTDQQAGQIVKEGLEGYINKGKKVIGNLYDDLDKYVKPTEEVAADKIDDVINTLRSEANTPGLLEGLEGSQAGKIMARLQGDIVTFNGQLPYSAIKKYRTEIGNHLKDVHLLKSEDEAVFSRLYGGLSETMRDTAAQKGSAALRSFERANNVNAAFMTKAKKQIEPLLRRDDVQELFNSVLRNQKIGNKAQSVMNTLNKGDKQIIRGSMIKEFGTNNAGDFSATKAATAIKGLEPEAREALKSGLTPEQGVNFDKALDALMLVKETAKQTNPSRTLYGGISGASLVGLAAKPVETGIILSGSHISARLMTNQKFIKWLANAEANMSRNPAEYIGKLGIIQRNATSDIADDIGRFVDSLKQPQESVAPAPQENDIQSLSDEQLLQIIQQQQNNSSTPSATTTQAPDITASINAAGEQSGVNPSLLTRIAKVESGLDPNAANPNSSASGLFQFTDGTWREMVKKYGKELGVAEGDKNDPQANALMAGLFTRDNQTRLQTALKRPPTGGETYMAHFLGANGALKLIRNRRKDVIAAKLFRDAAKANKSIFYDGKRARSTAEVYDILSNKV